MARDSATPLQMLYSKFAVGLNPFREDHAIVGSYEIIMESKTTFDDVKGVTEAKAELEEFVQYLEDPKCITQLGARFPICVLLVGPPGTGKTMLARAVAGEARVPFLSTSGGAFFKEEFAGMGSARISHLFAVAKKKSPCLIFIDELDAIVGTGSPVDSWLTRMSLNRLLVELDSLKQEEGIIVIGATSFPELLDKTLLSPGRFDHHVAVPLPDIEGRRQILEFHLSKVPEADDVDLMAIARGTLGFSGAELAKLVKFFEWKLAKDGSKAASMILLEYANARGGELIRTERSRELVAFHEAGRVLVAAYTDEAVPVQKATIVPQRMSSGFIAELDMCISKKQLLAKLDVFMGGRAAVEVVNGESEISYGPDGPEYDLEEAARCLARTMVTKYGMSKKVGLFYHDDENEMSADTKSLVDDEVTKFTNDASRNAKDIVVSHIEELRALADALLREETLTRSRIDALLSEVCSQQQQSSTRTAADSTRDNAQTLVPERKPFEGNEEGNVADLETLEALRKSRITIKEPTGMNDYVNVKKDKRGKRK